MLLFQYFDSVGWRQEGHLDCKKFYVSNPQRFAFEGF